MAGSQSGDDYQESGERLVDGRAEPVENPLKTIYRNVVEETSRRSFLTAAGVAGGALLGWYSDFDLDGSHNGEELRRGTGVLDADSDGDGVNDGGGLVGEHSDVERKAFEYVQEHFPEYTGHVVEFVDDGRLAEDFVDEQLRLFLDAPRNFQDNVLRAAGLYLNDWNKNGQAHLLPDGSPGPDYEHPYEPNPDGDAFMPGFYNSSATTHDVVSGEYRGFRPEKGDKVGKLGDRNGEGSIASYLGSNVSPQDLTGHMITVIWYDWMEGTAEIEFGEVENKYIEYTSKLQPETKKLLEETFESAPVNNPDGSKGIEPFFMEGEKVPHSKKTDSANHPDLPTREYFNEHVPEPIQGPVNYMLYGFTGYGVGLSVPPSEGGYDASPFSPKTEVKPFGQAHTTLHELYGHNIGGLLHRPDRETVMNQDSHTLDFLDSEWKKIVQGMDADNRIYFSPLGGRNSN